MNIFVSWMLLICVGLSVHSTCWGKEGTGGKKEDHASKQAYGNAVISAKDLESGLEISVEKDGRNVTARAENGKAIWTVNAVPKPEEIVGTAVVRNVQIVKSTVILVVGKHDFIKLNLKSGKILSRGSD